MVSAAVIQITGDNNCRGVPKSKKRECGLMQLRLGDEQPHTRNHRSSMVYFCDFRATVDPSLARLECDMIFVDTSGD